MANRNQNKSKKSKSIVIETQNLRKSFRFAKSEISVLRGVDLKVKEGELVVIFGPSGCGKSTLLNILLGLEEPTTGEVKILDEEIYNLSPDERAHFRVRRMGMVYQQPIWIRSLSVIENVAFPLYNLNLTKTSSLREARLVLSWLGLEKFKNHYPATLSGGEQQKVTVARAIVANPTIVFADEPTGNLDTKAAGEVIETLKFLNRKLGRTVILVTHNPQYLHLSKSLYYMEDGKVFKTSSQAIAKHIAEISI